MIYRYMSSSKNDSDKKHKKKSSKKKDNINYDVVQQIEQIQENIELNNQNNQNAQQNSIDTLNTMVANTSTSIEPSIDNVIDSIIQQNDDILDDDDIYELMTEKNEDVNDNEYQDNNYINFVSKTDKTGLNEAGKKIFS